MEMSAAKKDWAAGRRRSRGCRGVVSRKLTVCCSTEQVFSVLLPTKPMRTVSVRLVMSWPSSGITITSPGNPDRRLDSEDDSIRLYVSGDGVGLPEDYAER